MLSLGWDWSEFSISCLRILVSEAAAESKLSFSNAGQLEESEKRDAGRRPGGWQSLFYPLKIPEQWKSFGLTIHSENDRRSYFQTQLDFLNQEYHPRGHSSI